MICYPVGLTRKLAFQLKNWRPTTDIFTLLTIKYSKIFAYDLDTHKIKLKFQLKKIVQQKYNTS